MRNLKVKIVSISAALLTLAVLAGQVAKAQSDDSGSSAAGLFRANCAVCHGETGKGAVSIPGLPNFTDPKFQSTHSDDRINSTISYGRDEMPAFGDVLKPEQIRALVAYVRHFSPAPKGTPKTEAGKNPGAGSNTGEGLLERVFKGQGQVYDLTHAISENTPTYDGEKNQYHYQKQADVEKQGYTLGTVTIPEHFGTHVDAPAHFIVGAATIDKIDPRRLIAPAVVIDVREKVKDDPDYQLTVDAVEDWMKANGPIPDGAVVLLFTGWGARYSDANRYRNADSNGTLHFPGYSAAAVKYLVSHTKIVGLGIDTLSIDYGGSKEFEAHKVALGAGLYHIENVANLDKLPVRGAAVFVGPLPFINGSGSPARVLALVP